MRKVAVLPAPREWRQQGDGRPELQLDFRSSLFLVPAVLLSMFTLVVVSTSYVSFLFNFCCSNARVIVGKHSCTSSTFPIANQWYLFFRSVNAIKNWKWSACKLILLNYLPQVSVRASLPTATDTATGTAMATRQQTTRTRPWMKTSSTTHNSQSFTRFYSIQVLQVVHI